MLSRHLRRLSTLTLSPHFPKFNSSHLNISRHFSTNDNNNNGDKPKPSSDFWKMTQEDDNFGAVFKNPDGVSNEERESNQPSSWAMGDSGNINGGDEDDVFQKIFKAGKRENESKSNDGAADDWLSVKPWNVNVGEEDKRVEDVFGFGEFGDLRRVIDSASGGSVSGAKQEEEKKEEVVDIEQLQKEEEALLAVMKGPNRAFGDLVAASGITDAMLDSLIALKDFKGIDGLPPLTEIEDKRYENSLKKSSRYEMELQKQEEAAKARVRQVDEKGRAYGTGRRKCSIAQVWLQPGEGKVLVNEKEIDVYFPMLDHRAALLRPFAETKTLGLWDVKCSVKGGGVSGQVGAIRLGISRALQNWEPGLRPPLREAGFLTRDPRAVERKKPGKAKARKSFQWVKR